MNPFYHEEIYRGPRLIAKLHDFAVTICGAGALGANITENLARAGFATLKVIDRDRIEEQNLSTQPYYRSDIGSLKAKILSNYLYRALAVSVEAHPQTLTVENASKFLKGSNLVVDAFDNSDSRGLLKNFCHTNQVPCLHVGLAADYAEIIWNEIYRIPSPAAADVCDYPLARNLVTLTVAVACEVIVAFVADQKRQSFTITWRDFAVRPFERI